MKKGFKLKDGSIWTIISYDSTKEYWEKSDSDVFPSNVLSVTGVEWRDGRHSTHPYNANFSDCLFETFDVNDERIEVIVADVFDLIDMGYQV